MMNLQKCKQCKLTCFNRTQDGKCKILENTEFKKPCPFAKSLQQECIELYDIYIKNMMYLSFSAYLDLLSDFYDIFTYKDIKRVLLEMNKKEEKIYG